MVDFGQMLSLLWKSYVYYCIPVCICSLETSMFCISNVRTIVQNNPEYMCILYRNVVVILYIYKLYIAL